MYRLKITDADFEYLRTCLFASYPREAGAFALAGAFHRNDGMDILVRRPVQVPPHLFLVQREERLEVSSQAINGLAALCEANKLGAVICHSHPEDSLYSPSDDFGEQRIFKALESFIPKRAPMASLLFYPDGIRGRVWLPDRRKFAPMAEVVVLGRSIHRMAVNQAGLDEEPGELYDRQVRAFGKTGQALISHARVAIVGVGGTGSPTAEQLVRLGVRDLVLVDHDTFTASNLTRMYGTFAAPSSRWRWGRRKKSEGRLKVTLLAEHLRKIQPNIQLRSIPRNVVLRDAAESLLDRDVIFLCTDEHWGRSVVNELAYQYLIPTINLGMSIRSQDGSITGASGAVDVIRPGTACLWCSRFLNSGRISAESLSRSQRRSLQGEGYVEDIDTPAPSVISMTTALSGMAVTLFLQLVTDFMGTSGAISHLRYDIMNGTVRRGTTQIVPDCVCQKAKGFGDLRRLPALEALPLSEGV